MLSTADRQACLRDGKKERVDPESRFYRRKPVQRLDAEALRDAMLFIAGNLDSGQPGEHPFPKIEDWHWTQPNPFRAVFESNRRSVYLMTQRIQRHPYLALFGAPDANTTTDMRSESTVPLKALYWMNNKFVQVQATAFAQRVLAASNDQQDRIRLACQLAWARPPTASELKRSTQYLDCYRQELAATGVGSDELDLEAWASYGRVVPTANEFFYAD